MINIDGDECASETIQEELYLAGIDFVNKKYDSDEQIVNGKLGNWTFMRAPECWMASSTPRIGKGIPLDLATTLYERKYPLEGKNHPKTYGHVVIVEGQTELTHPSEWANPELGALEKAINSGQLEGLSSKEIREKCNAGVLDLPRFINSYLVDTQIGLNEFARVVREVTFGNRPTHTVRS